MRMSPAKVRWALVNRRSLGFLCKQEGRAWRQVRGAGRQGSGKQREDLGTLSVGLTRKWAVGKKGRPGHRSVGGEAAEAQGGPLRADPARPRPECSFRLPPRARAVLHRPKGRLVNAPPSRQAVQLHEPLHVESSIFQR